MCAGISGPHISFEEAADAYREAMEARIQAFCTAAPGAAGAGRRAGKFPVILWNVLFSSFRQNI